MQGHIKRRAPGSWTVVLNMGRDPKTGKRKQLWRSIKAEKRAAAEELLAQLISQRDTGIDAPPGKMTLAEFLAFWLERYARTSVEPATFLQYKWAIDRHVVPALGRLALTKVRPAHIQTFYTELVTSGRTDGRGGLSGKSVKHIHTTLREALGYAVKWQMLARNPADAADAPRVQPYEPPALTLELVRKVLAEADTTSYGVMVHTAAMTGLRRGELLGLRWQDIDLEAASLRVLQAAQWLSGKARGLKKEEPRWMFRPPKTRGSRRAVALAQSTVARLREHRRQQLEARVALGPAYDDFGLVFATPVGTPIDPAHLRRAWTAIARAAGHPGLHFHDLRHAHATLLLAAGTNPKIVSERLGHSAVGITLDTYSHVLPGLQEHAVEGLDRLLARG